MFNPAFRSQGMRARMSGGKPDSVILTYVGRLGAGGPCLSPDVFPGLAVVILLAREDWGRVATHLNQGLVVL